MAEHDLVSMTYTGTNAGPITFTVNGRAYRGANNDSDRVVQVHPDDVEGLENLRLWKRTPHTKADPDEAQRRAEAKKTAADKAAQEKAEREANTEQPQSDVERRNADKG
jgi:hypothetical protein